MVWFSGDKIQARSDSFRRVETRWLNAVDTHPKDCSGEKNESVALYRNYLHYSR